ncbi:ETS transcription factor Elf 2 [Fasciolopsis buskii]|uniref:ETS transcription factor Elf 2 n=1 Tax=Fasciolopsis buskii TaxID=27845 RepID=A0A8E0VLP7_9TREM|nr:ETS transcription factor Elf 2 [Fasciolopsis buski]
MYRTDPKVSESHRSNALFSARVISSEDKFPLFYSNVLPTYRRVVYPQSVCTSPDVYYYDQALDGPIQLYDIPEDFPQQGTISVSTVPSKLQTNALSKAASNTDLICDPRAITRNINLTDPLMTDIVGESEKQIHGCDDASSLYDVISSSSLSPCRSHACNFACSHSHPDPDSPLSIESDWLSNVDLSVSCSSPSSASGVSPLPPVIREPRPDPYHPPLPSRKSRLFRFSRGWKSSGRCAHSVRPNLVSAARIHATKSFRHLAPRDPRHLESHSFLSMAGSRKRPMCLSRPLRGSPSVHMTRNDASRLLSTSAHGYTLCPTGLSGLTSGSHTKGILVNPILAPNTTISSSYPSSTTNELAHSAKRLHLLDFIICLLGERNINNSDVNSVSLPQDPCSCSSPSSVTCSCSYITKSEPRDADSPTACVEWVDEDAGVFSIKNPVRLAELWGTYKNNRNMTFESLCRSLRLYYVSGKLERVRGQRNQYRLLDEPLH